MDFILRKIAYLYLRMTEWFIHRKMAKFVEQNPVKDKPEKIKSIAAVWYFPSDYPAASHTRLGRWKEYFESEGIQFDNFHVSSMKDVTENYEGTSWTKRYLFYRRILKTRFAQFKKLKNYDVIWVDRWFYPYYPSEDAYWEENIKKIAPYLVVDSTDGGDYESNPELILKIFSAADKITVAFEGLHDFFKPIFGDKVERFNYTIIEDDYIIKESWKQKDMMTIGWMGSPYNFEYVKSIEPALQEVAKNQPFNFVIICRKQVEINIPGAKISYHQYGDDYEELIASFDIGIAPFTEKSFSNTGKIGMKHQEFLLCRVPHVTSPQGISEHAKHNEHCLIADSLDDWSEMVLELLNNEQLRTDLSHNGRLMCRAHYSFDGQWHLAKKALTEF